MFLLDTNVISELRRPDRANAGVLSWARNQPVEAVFISVVSIMELELGVLSMERQDIRQGAILRRWLEAEVVSRFGGAILAVDQPIARRCAVLHVPDRRPERDALIAATALVHGLTLVTRNVRDFVSAGIELVNPWDGTGRPT
jgi:predicted nucleic acid-binding protein